MGVVYGTHFGGVSGQGRGRALENRTAKLDKRDDVGSRAIDRFSLNGCYRCSL